MTQAAELGFIGHPPEAHVGAGNPEAEKYGRMWAHDEYRKVAPGEILASEFLAQAKPRHGAHVIDFGCGTGRGALMLSLLGQCRVTMLDFVRNSLDADIRAMLKAQAHALAFKKHDLEQPIPLVAEYGFCTDVMEHIPTKKVETVLANILKSANHVYFSISTTADSCGAMIDEELHLTVQDYHWWLAQLQKFQCIIHWSIEEPGRCAFYVTAWATGQKISDMGMINTVDELIRANVTHNIGQGWNQIGPAPANDMEVMILGGGPSLESQLGMIRILKARGVKIVCLNGAYGWALEHDLAPCSLVMVDAREFNKRFSKPAREDCMYFIASQCHPDVLEGLPKDRTWLWQTNPDLIKDLMNEQYGEGKWMAIPGGSTVLFRAIPLLRQLGYSKFHLFGCDSCVMDGAHHAYPQPENNNTHAIPVIVGNKDGGSVGQKVFQCHPWMIAQANDMMELVRVLGEVIQIEVYGGGLLAHILQTGADLAIEEGLAIEESEE